MLATIGIGIIALGLSTQLPMRSRIPEDVDALATATH